jgi:hypothetical protein
MNSKLSMVTLHSIFALFCRTSQSGYHLSRPTER